MIDSVARHWLNHPRLRRAALAIRAGGVVAYPTEAVWGLGCDPLNAEAVDTILDLKGRKMAKGVILIAADLAQALPFVAPLTPGDCERLVRPGPGPVTWVVPASALAPVLITGGRDTLALRITGHPVAAAQCRLAGMPLVSPSANPQGLPPARCAMKVHRYFGDRLADITPGTVGRAAKPSEIRDIRTGAILRPGG